MLRWIDALSLAVIIDETIRVGPWGGLPLVDVVELTIINPNAKIVAWVTSCVTFHRARDE